MMIFKNAKILYAANKDFVISFFKNSKLYLVLQSLFLILTVPINYITVYAPKMFIDNILSNQDLIRAILWIVILISCRLFNVFANQTLTIYRNHYYAKAKVETKKKIYEELNNIYISFFDNSERLNNFSRAFAYNDTGGTILMDSVISFSTCIVSLFTLTIISTTFEWWLWIIIMLLVLQQFFADRKMKKMNFDYMKEKTLRDRRQNYFASVPTQRESLSELLINNGVCFFLDKHSKLYSENINIQRKHNMRINFRVFINMLPNEIFTFFCYIMIGAKLINGKATIGDYTLFFSLLTNITSTFKTFLYSFNTFYQQALEAQEYLKFLEQNEHKRPLLSNLNISNITSIEMRNVSFYYDGMNTPTLKNINVKINEGDRIAIVGNNGAGKTTFIKLLLSLYHAQSGEVLINNISIENFNSRQYWNRVSAVFQNHQEFSMSIIENLVFHDPDSNDYQKATQSLKKVDLYDKLSRNKKGLQTELTRYFFEDGIELSGGERQRIAIARAIFKDCDLYIFDEPSSSLDPMAENELLAYMNSMPLKSIVIHISHRLTNIQFCNRILYFKDGQIIADGTHEELMKSCFDYRIAYETQAKKYRLSE